MRLTGRIRGTRAGFAFFVADEGGEDLFVAAEALGGAVHGDRVRVVVSSRGGRDFRPEVEVEEILGRSGDGFTGNLFRLGKSWYVRPDSPLLPERLRLRPGTDPAVEGAKILFRVENRPGREAEPIAVYDRMLGDGDDATLDPVVLATEYSLPLGFPEEAWREAEQAIGRAGDPEDDRREDFRAGLVLTIDPADAKDFDDAVGLDVLPDGWRLYVHIADVSFYVREGGALDREARRRAASVYFPGSVLPMLPDSLSTLTASLAPDEDRRTLSAVLDFDRDGARRGARFTRGWIRSRARLEYRQAQEILDGGGPADAETAAALRAMGRLAGILRARRFAEGGFALDLPETEMRLGADGVPQTIRRRETLASHHLIEEFMIAANRAVGEMAFARSVPFLFRVHQEPDALALERFLEVARTLLPGTHPSALGSLPRLRRWIEALPDSPVGRAVQRFFLRSLRKALYSPVDLGHFGLGIRQYCHFTSPIRRYPDLCNHRRVKEWIDGRPPSLSWEEANGDALASSRGEMIAEEAEREMVRLKVARYMERHLGDEYAAHVTGLSPLGLFVELDAIPVEGFIPREELPPGFRLTEERLAFLDARSGGEIRPGDALRVRVQRADLRARRVEFAPVDPRPRAGRPRASRSARAGRRTGARRDSGARRRQRKGHGSRPERGGRDRGGAPRPPDRPRRSRTAGARAAGGRRPRRGGGRRRPR